MVVRTIPYYNCSKCGAVENLQNKGLLIGDTKITTVCPGCGYREIRAVSDEPIDTGNTEKRLMALQHAEGTDFEEIGGY